jgi:hypothetical protein
MHTKFIQYPGRSPVLVMYLEPLMDNTVEMEELYAVLRTMQFFSSNFGFSPHLCNGELPECIVCESLDHPLYTCNNTNIDLRWWACLASSLSSPTLTPITGHGSGGGRGGEGAETTAVAVAATTMAVVTAEMAVLVMVVVASVMALVEEVPMEGDMNTVEVAASAEEMEAVDAVGTAGDTDTGTATSQPMDTRQI